MVEDDKYTLLGLFGTLGIGALLFAGVHFESVLLVALGVVATAVSLIWYFKE